MDGRESSADSSTDFYGSEAKPATPMDHAPAKRKADDAPSLQDKKRKRDSPSATIASSAKSSARLPPAAWQHIFLFCSLADLGRLMQVNRSFFSYLSDVRNVSVSQPDSGCLRLLKSESIWASARNALSPRPPKPLAGFTELQMWRLAWSKRCQFCNQLSSFTPGEKPWQQGPGEAGVRTIWPFAIRTCGPCLMQQCQTDSSLLFSPNASVLRPGLPFALITADHNYVPAHVLQSTPLPVNVEVAKYYYKAQVQEMTLELDAALSHGPAAAEEWSKGLDSRGKDRMKVAENWEKWETKYRPEPMSRPAPSPSPRHQIPSPIIHTPVPVAPTSHYAHRPPTVPPHAYTPQPGQPGSTQPSHQRNLHDANEAKANRKSDIERRCQQLDPPIPPTLLRHMDTFKAAVQISQPMTDHAWTVLVPRLLAQLPAAQQAEAEHVSRAASITTKSSDRRYQDVNSKEAKEIMDREWDEAQRPIRDKLNAIADDFIKREWDHGNAVTYDNSQKFAADVLIHVRRTYLESTATGEDVKTANTTDGRTKLVLENMKWVYDNMIKPLTEPFRKDLYLCNASNCESGAKYYGFEGIVQHFAAKHTHTFSSGNVVVAWRDAEWPEDPPFHPDPDSVKQTWNPLGHGYPGFRAGTSTPRGMQPYIMPQASPGPYNYHGSYSGPFAPPQVPGPAYGGQPDGYPYQHIPPVPMSGPGYIPSPAPGFSTMPPHPATMPPPPQAPAAHVPDAAEATSHSTSLFDKQVSTIIDMSQDIWKHTSGIKDMPNSLRIYILLHRVISKFHIEFDYEPNLNHFIDAFSSHKVSKSLKNAPGLSCKACQVESAYQHGGAHAAHMDRKTFIVSSLLVHFQNQHLPSQPYNFGHPHQAPTPDWKEDMIELPSERFISGLIHAAGMDNDKLLIIATVFPSLFPTPLPKIAVATTSGLASPPLSGPKDDKDGSESNISKDPVGQASSSTAQAPSKPGEEYDPQRPALPPRNEEAVDPLAPKHAPRESPAGERRQRYYEEPRYYMSRDAFEDYGRPRDYQEYAPSPRIVHAGPAYTEYSGRRTVFREHDKIYRPPAEDSVFVHSHEGSRSREISGYTPQYRYYEDDDQQPEYHFAQQRDDSPSQAQSAADRFLEDFVPGQPASDPKPTATPTENKTAAPTQDNEESMRHSPAPSAALQEDPGLGARPLVPPYPKAPSTMSNGSRFDEYRTNGRHIPTPESAGPRRAGPHRRRDRPHDHRMPHSRYYRYLSVAREDPYGRGPSMSRSQSRRYEEQRRRIDQQETPAPNAERDYEPAYSRDPSVDHHSPEDNFYHRQSAREYVSVQDRLHHYSPPRYHRYEEQRGPPPMYVDQYGHPIQEYEVVRVRGEPRHTRTPYVSYQPPMRYEPDCYEYVPIPYDRPPPQRYNSRGEYVYYEERERALPRRPAQPEEPEPFEPPPPEIKVENTVVPMPEGP